MRLVVTGGSGFIGTNVVEAVLARGWDCVNLDIKKPINPDHQKFWRKMDICDGDVLRRTIYELRPDYIIHLAAKTGIEIKSAEAFRANTDGVSNILEAAKAVAKRIVITSSLLVCRNGYIPASDIDYCPPNLYGESKVETEKRVRAIDAAELPWTIVRPTSVWGPWFDGGYKRFFETIRDGTYMHPGSAEVVKPLTFSGNAAYMLLKMLKAPPSDVVARTFYLVDWPARGVREWADAIAKAFGTRPIRTLPLPLMRIVAAGGDVLKLLGVPEPPLTTFRLNNMLTGGAYPADKTANVVGELPFSMEAGVAKTVAWMNRSSKRSEE